MCNSWGTQANEEVCFPSRHFLCFAPDYSSLTSSYPPDCIFLCFSFVRLVFQSDLVCLSSALSGSHQTPTEGKKRSCSSNEHLVIGFPAPLASFLFVSVVLLMFDWWLLSLSAEVISRRWHIHRACRLIYGHLRFISLAQARLTRYSSSSRTHLSTRTAETKQIIPRRILLWHGDNIELGNECGWHSSEFDETWLSS